MTAARSDLAAQHLEGQVTASRFVAGVMREILDPSAPLRREPSPEALLDTEALMGERVTVYETTDEGWAWGQLAGDGYVGWLPANALGAPGPAATHKVCVPRTLVFPGPSIKLPPIAALSFGARVAIVRERERFAVTANGGHLPANHLAPFDAFEGDYVAVAERFIGVPYLWGGKTSLGLDCSGLSQLALSACGISCPRDSDMQEQALGTAMTPNTEFSNLRRGDVVFWKGHIALVRDADTLVHANAFHMAVAIEPIRAAIARVRKTDGAPTSVRRL